MFKIPKNNSYGQTMTYYCVTSETQMTAMTRTAFMNLIRTTANGYDHVLPDFEAAVVYFIQDSDQYATTSRVFRNEAECQRKKLANNNECVLRGTSLCDGWKETTCGKCCCDFCESKQIRRAYSLNETIKDEEGNTIEFGDTIVDDVSDTPEEIAMLNEDRDILREALNLLNDSDREYILAYYRDGMNFVKMAQMYGIDRHFASKRAGRIEARIRKNLRKV